MLDTPVVAVAVAVACLRQAAGLAVRRRPGRDAARVQHAVLPGGAARRGHRRVDLQRRDTILF